MSPPLSKYTRFLDGITPELLHRGKNVARNKSQNFLYIKASYHPYPPGQVEKYKY